MSKFWSNKSIRYLVVGGVSTIFAFITFPLVHYQVFKNTSVISSYILATFLNVTFSFVGQKFVVFKTSGSIWKDYLAFWIGSALIIVLGYMLLICLINYCELSIFLSNGIVVTLSAIGSFGYHNYITFRST